MFRGLILGNWKTVWILVEMRSGECHFVVPALFASSLKQITVMLEQLCKPVVTKRMLVPNFWHTLI